MTKQHFYIKNGKPQRQAGYTLVELSITVSIIAVLLAGSLIGVNRLLNANKVNTTLTQTTAAVSNISRLTTSIGTTALNTANMRQLGAWDPGQIRTATRAADGVVETSIENPFGGTVEIAANTAGVGNFRVGSGYWYRISNIPESSCANLATAFYSTAPGIYINNTTSGGAAIGATPDADRGYKRPGQNDSVANLTTRCTAGAGENGTVEIALFIPL
jgi:prepilin-type N-terminal cleavage/methylation domain-containing protein